jgi:transglutaminase-like putative cysteine protease
MNYLFFLVFHSLIREGNGFTSPLDAQSMKARVKIQSGVEFEASGNSQPDISSVLATLTSFPRESFHQSVQKIDVTGNPQPEAVTRDEFNNLQLYWKTPQTGQCNFQLKAEVETENKVLPIKQKIRFPIEESILPPEIVNDFLKITEIANQSPNIQELAHTIADSVSDKTDLYHVVFEIANWISMNIKYNIAAMETTSLAVQCRSAAETLESGTGKCDELSALFVSLNRALGIPARFVTGYAYTNIPLLENANKIVDDKQWGGHAWAEAYFPGIGWAPFDVSFGEFGFLSSGHILLSTSDDAADNTNVHYHAQGFDFTIIPRTIDISVASIDLVESSEGWNSQNNNLQLSLEPLDGDSTFEIGEAVELICKLENPNDHYLCAQLQVAKTQDTTLSEGKMDCHVLLNPRETKEIPFTFDIDSSLLNKGFAYEFPFSVQCGRQEGRTTIRLSSAQAKEKRQEQALSMQWEAPASAGRRYFDDYGQQREGPPLSTTQYNTGRLGQYDTGRLGQRQGPTGNHDGEWWGEVGETTKSMFQKDQPRQPSPEDWNQQQQNQLQYSRQDSFYQDNRFDTRQQPPYYQPPPSSKQVQQNEFSSYGRTNEFDLEQRGTDSFSGSYQGYHKDPYSASTSTMEDSDWYKKYDHSLNTDDASDGWWSKESKQGSTKRDYASTYTSSQYNVQNPQNEPATSWSRPGTGRYDDTRTPQALTAYDNSYAGDMYNRGYESFDKFDRGQQYTSQNQYSSYNNDNSKEFQKEQYFEKNRYDTDDPRQKYQQHGYRTEMDRGIADSGSWRGDRETRNDKGSWQRNDLIGRSRERYIRERMPQPSPSPPYDSYDDPSLYSNRPRGNSPYPPPYQQHNQDSSSVFFSAENFGNVDQQQWWDKE